MECRVLGPLEILADGEPVPIPGSKQRLILALLVLNVGATVGSERLIDVVWGDDPPRSAPHALAVHIFELRRLLPPEVIETRPQGYGLRPTGLTIDLVAFERHAAAGIADASRGDAHTAADEFARALALWRGPALADLAAEPAIRAARARLDELFAVVLEHRIDADLDCGRHRDLLPELRRRADEAPLNEALGSRLMLALYRSGRQADALEVYHQIRDLLQRELGIDPGPGLEAMQRAILAHDPNLELAHTSPSPAGQGPTPTVPTQHGPPPSPVRELIVTTLDDDGLEDAIDASSLLAADGRRGIVLGRLLSPGDSVAEAATSLRTRRAALEIELGTPVRSAAFTTSNWALDVADLATRMDADLIIVGGWRPHQDGRLPRSLVDLFDAATGDVAVVMPSGSGTDPSGDRAVRRILVPFSGSDHDWAALELSAWLARSTGAALAVAGQGAPAADARHPDASRLIANACLILQRALQVDAEPVLIDRSTDSLDGEARQASVAVLGFPDRWRAVGVGRDRMALAAHVEGIVLGVHGGMRPGGLAPGSALSHYRWSIGPR